MKKTKPPRSLSRGYALISLLVLMGLLLSIVLAYVSFASAVGRQANYQYSADRVNHAHGNARSLFALAVSPSTSACGVQEATLSSTDLRVAGCQSDLNCQLKTYTTTYNEEVVDESVPIVEGEPPTMKTVTKVRSATVPQISVSTLCELGTGYRANREQVFLGTVTQEESELPQ